MDYHNSLTSLSRAVEAIKTAILQSQERAAKGVNVTQLSLYFSIGRFVSINSRLQKWGSGAIKSISEQLQKELPGLKGFSAESITKMRRFYEEWSAVIFQSPVATEMAKDRFQPLIGEIQSPMATELKIGNNDVE